MGRHRSPLRRHVPRTQQTAQSPPVPVDGGEIHLSGERDEGFHSEEFDGMKRGI